MLCRVNKFTCIIWKDGMYSQAEIMFEAQCKTLEFNNQNKEITPWKVSCTYCFSCGQRKIFIVNKVRKNQIAIWFCKPMEKKLNLKIYLVWFDLFGFNGISTIVGYLIPGSIYIHLSNIYDL